MEIEQGEIPRCMYCSKRHSVECRDNIKTAQSWYARSFGPLIDNCQDFGVDMLEIKNKYLSESNEPDYVDGD